MKITSFISFTLGMTLASALGNLGHAQTASSAAAPVSSPSATPDYHPSMGDLMTMAIQPRHIKLGLAGKARNWNYATYELSELRNAFARIGRTIPVYQNADTVALISTLTDAPLAALKIAIDAREESQFASAYRQLTQACNACHVSQNHAAVVIRVPVSSMYPDQDLQAPSH
jgi:hypothetical protein